MTLVQTVRITQKDKWEQNNEAGRKTNRHLVKTEPNSSNLPASTLKPATKKQVRAIVKQIIKKNPQTLILLNEGKKAIK